MKFVSRGISTPSNINREVNDDVDSSLELMYADVANQLPIRGNVDNGTNTGGETEGRK